MDEVGENLMYTQHVEDPPFALVEQNSPQHLFVERKGDIVSPRTVTGLPELTMKRPNSFGDSQSTPPGLVESVLTEESSSAQSSSAQSNGDSGIISQQGTSQYLDASSTFLMSSLPMVGGAMGESSHLPHSRDLGQYDLPHAADPMHLNIGGASGDSAGFSQLMHAADDKNEAFSQSRMPMVPEGETVEESEYTSPSLGTLIAASPEDDRTSSERGWFPSFLSPAQPVDGLNAPLLGSSTINSPLLSYAPSPMSITRAREGIKSFHDDHQSFEVSMTVEAPCVAQDVMSILGNPELLKLWCDPIRALVVTKSSEEAGDHREAEQGREYEGQWIEATTGSLESPPSNVGYVYNAGRLILENLGLSSYGKVTMFVERPRGQVGLTVGPFSGGVYAAHTISIVEDGNLLKVVDRVRLTKAEDELGFASMFFCGGCGVFDSLNRCLLPTVVGYMEQVESSMARLRVLCENGQTRTRLGTVPN
jgi:hypothetical protein